MGMYTEVIFGARLKPDTPEEVIDGVKKLIDGREETIQIDHPFFKTDRTWLLRSGGSYYFSGIMRPIFEYDPLDKGYSLHFRVNVKNYNNEIEKFLDWIKPHIKQGSGVRDFYAIVTHEEDSEPTIYYLN